LRSSTDFRRLRDHYKTSATFYGAEFSPDDIRQGYLGDCYYLSALSAIAEDHTDLVDMWTNTERSSTGIYSMWGWPKGVPTEVVMDDFLPSRKYSDNLLHTRFAHMGGD
jgi:hypothetical protein